MFNSGQSCCGIERVYVHEAVYDRFVEEVVKVVKVRSRSSLLPPIQFLPTSWGCELMAVCDCDPQGYKLGDPREQETTLGPVVSLRSAATIREHIAEAGTSRRLTPLRLSLSVFLFLQRSTLGSRSKALTIRTDEKNHDRPPARSLERRQGAHPRI